MVAFKPLAAILSLLLLAGCESMAMQSQTIAYNQAVADSTNEFFLLNVMRARDRFPLYYTRSTGNNASQSSGGGVSTDIENWHFLPTIGVNAGAGTTVSMANLDDQKFMRGVLTPVPLSTLGFYLDQGWPKEVVMDMFVKSVEIDRGLVSSLVARFMERCADSHQNASYCDARRPLGEDNLPLVSPGTFVLDQCAHSRGGATPSRTIVFENYPGDPEGARCFRAMLRVLLALGLGVTTGDKFTVVVPSMPAKAAHNLPGLSEAATAKLVVARRPDGDYAVCSRADASAFTLDADAFATGVDAAAGFFDSPNAATTSVVANVQPQTCDQAANPPPPAGGSTTVFQFTTRSLDSMLYYLGEDVRAQSEVTVWSGHRAERQKEVPLFVVSRDASDELVAVNYRGVHYAIPDECAGDDTCEQDHRSLQVLSLLNQIWGLQKEASEAPSVPVVSVVNSR